MKNCLPPTPPTNFFFFCPTLQLVLERPNDEMLLKYRYVNYVWKDKYSVAGMTKTFLGYFLVA